MTVSKFCFSESVMGLASRRAAEQLIEVGGLNLSVDEYLVEIEAEYPKVFRETKLLPGVEQLLKHFKHHRIPMAVVTSSKETSFRLKTNHLSEFFTVGNYFHHIIKGFPDDPEVTR